MKKNILSFLFLSMLLECSYAQVVRCDHEKLLTENFNMVLEKADRAKSQSIFVIPTVVHVVYKSQTENISESQIMSQFNVINNDFRLRNSDTLNVDPDFSKADVKIEFCLARRDPDGNPSSGINRISTNEDDIGLSERYYQIQPAWNPDEYLNIWVVDYGEINGNIVLGRATPPGHTPRSQDGVVINYQAFGTTGPVVPSYDLGRTLTHEIGHWLNLLHIWGRNDQNPNCADDDLIADTPNQSDVYFNCNTNPSLSCGSKDMLSNYMGYVEDACMGNFTEGQRDWMRTALVTLRPSLLLSNGCLPVGLDEVKLKAHTHIFPNPVNQKLTIQFDQMVDRSLEARIHDLKGKLIHASTIPEGTTSHSIATFDLKEGVYLLILKDFRFVIKQKIVVQH